MNGVHDLGGEHGHGPVSVEKDEPVFHERWEARVYGMMRRCIQTGVWSTDEMRFAIERIPPAEYLEDGYYERWLAALERLVPEKTRQGPSGKEPPPEKVEPRWKPGDRVRTKNLNPKGHIRLPRYARDKVGVVESVEGPWLLPDLLAELKGYVWQPVYTVVFESRELWGEQGREGDKVSLNLWEEYLIDA